MNLLKDNIPKLLRSLAIPASIGTLFQTLYNIVDTYFAGKISPEALSALSKSFPIYFVIIATSIGVTVAGTALIGNSIGENNKKNILYYFANLIIYSFLISIIISILGLTLAEKIFVLMKSSEEVVNYGLQYTNIIYAGSLIFILVVALNSLLHAQGDTKTYRNVLVLSFLLNIILNPLFIFGFLFIPAFGVAGIGYATIICQLISLLIILSKVLRNPLIKQITFKFFQPKFFYLKNIFFQSMPISIAICGYSIAAAIIFTYVGSFGEYATAGYGAATRIEQVVLLPILGINTALISIISQNYGAKNFDRIIATYHVALRYSFYIMLISGFIIYMTADLVPLLFSNDIQVIDYSSRYLKISAFVLPAYPFFFLSNGFFMALKKSENAMLNNIVRNVAVPIIVFYLARYLSADYNSFFWLWVVFQWTISIALLLIVKFYLTNRLYKSRAIINP